MSDSKKIVWRSVTSANPAKPAIVAALRAAAGVSGGKVTNVVVSKDGSKVAGHVMVRDPNRMRGFMSVGEITCAAP